MSRSQAQSSSTTDTPSALTAKKVAKYETKFCESPGCRTRGGAKQGAGNMPRNADLHVSILGMPAALLCKKCFEKWQEWWDKSLNGKVK